MRLPHLRVAPETQLTLVAGALAALLSLYMQSPWVVLSPDGWAYWEGSLSLLRGEGYRYLDGSTLGAWPPGFSLYLALWQAVAGVSAGTLAVAHATAIGAASALWAALVLRSLAAPRLAPSAIAAVAVVALVVPINLRTVLSESLFMALFAAALLVAIGPRQAPEPTENPDAADHRPRQRARPWLLGLCGAALLLTRHAGVAVLPALIWLYAVSTPATLRSRRRMAALAAAIAGSVGLWIGSRVVLDQLDHNRQIPLDESALARGLDNLGANLMAFAANLLPGSVAGLTATAVLVAALLVLADLGGGPRGSRLRISRAPAIPGLGVATALAVGASALLWILYDVRGKRIALSVTALVVVLVAQWSEIAPRRGQRHLVRALLIVLGAIQVGRGLYWIHHAATVEATGLAWSTELVAPCPPDRICPRAPGQLAPPEYPWVTRNWDRARDSPPRGAN